MEYISGKLEMHKRKSGAVIRIHFIRHGKTIGNSKRQYIGSTDEPLCPEGVEALLQKKCSGMYPPERDIESTIFSSPMCRCVETARVLYPDLKIEVIDGFRETDFGPFEGKTYEQLCRIPEYRNWIDSRGEEICPGMEKRSQMQKRCARALEELFGKRVIGTEANQTGKEDIPDLDQKTQDKQFVFIVHGGTIMALMQEFGIKETVPLELQGQNSREVSGQEADNYYQYQRENGCGITCSLIKDYQGKFRLKWEGNIG